MVRGAPLVASLLMVAAVAGCVGSNDDDEAVGSASAATATEDADDPLAPLTPAAAEEAQAAEDSGRKVTTLAYPLEGPTHSIVWGNGSFAVTDACGPVGCAVATVTGEPSWERALDVSDKVPRGVPVTVLAEAHFDRQQMGDLDIVIRAESVYDGVWDYEGDGSAKLESTFIARDEGPVEVVVEAWEADLSAGFDYTLRVELTARPFGLVENEPVAFELPAGATTLLVSSTEEGDVELLLWGPDDALIGRFETDEDAGANSFDLPADAAEGEYVALVVAAGGPVTLSVVADAAAGPWLRALALEWTEGAPHPMDPTTGATWSFDAQGLVVAVGAYWTFALPASAYDGLTIEVTSPAGTVLALEAGSTIFVASNGAWWATSDLGDPNIVAGTYDAVATAGASANVAVGEIVAHIVR